MVTFISLKPADGGGWGLKGSEAEMVPGASVVVRKRSGDTTVMVVGEIVWKGDGMAVAKVDGGCAKRSRSRTPKARSGYSGINPRFRGQARVALKAAADAVRIEQAQEAFDEEAAEMRACGFPEDVDSLPVLPATQFELDISEGGEVELYADDSVVKVGGRPQIGVRFANGVKTFNCIMVQRSDERVPGDGEVAGWIYTPAGFGPATPVKAIRIVND